MKVTALDANVILRFLTRDHPIQWPRCEALLARLETGEETAYLPEVAVCDVVWTLKSFYQ